MARFKKFRATEREVALLQDNVDSYANQVSNLGPLNGRFITATLIVGDNKIEHKLGRKISYYQVGTRSAHLEFYDKITTTDTELETYFTLVSDTACTVVLWVF